MHTVNGGPNMSLPSRHNISINIFPLRKSFGPGCKPPDYQSMTLRLLKDSLRLLERGLDHLGFICLSPTTTICSVTIGPAKTVCYQDTCKACFLTKASEPKVISGVGKFYANLWIILIFVAAWGSENRLIHYLSHQIMVWLLRPLPIMLILNISEGERYGRWPLGSRSKGFVIARKVNDMRNITTERIVVDQES